MAWFDYLSNVGQALGQGTQQLQRQQQLRLENARQQRQLALQEAIDRRAEEEAAATEYERLLAGTDVGEAITPDLLAELTQPRFAKYAKSTLTKTPDGKVTRRMSEAQRQQRAVAQAAFEEATQTKAARERIRALGRSIYDYSPDDRRAMAVEAGYDPDRFLLLKDRVAEAAAMAKVSPSVLSAREMAGLRASTQGVTTTQEAYQQAIRDFQTESRTDPRLVLQSDAVKEQWIQARMQRYLSASGQGGGMAPGMPAGYVVVE